MSGFVQWYRRYRARTLTPPTSGGDIIPPGPGVQAKRAFEFWDSVGVNTHLTRVGAGAFGNAYTDVDATVNALQRLNIRHIRDGSAIRSAAFITAINRCFTEAGALCCAMLGEPSRTPKATLWPTALLDYYFTNGLNIDAISAFEGGNEQNLPNHNQLPVAEPGIHGYIEAEWAEANIEHMTEAFTSLHSVTRPTAWRNKPYLGYGYGNINNTARLIQAAPKADWDALCDIGNIHKYAPDNPATGITTPLASLRTYQYNAPGKIVHVTETGHHTLMDSTDAHPPTPEDATAWDMVRLPFTWLRQPNVTRMHYYELVDEYHPNAGKGNQAYFGQFRYKAPGDAGIWAFKPSGQAISNLLGIFKDPTGAAYVPAKLDYTIVTSAPSLNVTLHQRSTDDAFLLTLYRDGSIWRYTGLTPPHGTYTAFADVNVTIDLGAVYATVEHRDPSNVVGAGGGPFLVETLTNVSTVTIPVGKRLKVLVIK